MIWAPTHYQMGTAVRMGPAYFPAVLGGLLGFLGIARSHRIDRGRPAGAEVCLPAARFPLISAACVIYGYTMKPLGLDHRHRAAGVHQRSAATSSSGKVTILYVILIVFSPRVREGLTLPFPICPAFMETCSIR